MSDEWKSFRENAKIIEEEFAKLMWPYAQVKLHPLEQIIDHYEPEFSDDNVVSLEDYRNEKR